MSTFSSQDEKSSLTTRRHSSWRLSMISSDVLLRRKLQTAEVAGRKRQKNSPLVGWLPGELLLQIAWGLSSTRDVVNFSMTSSAVYSAVIPALYARVDLGSTERCQKGLEYFWRRPDLSRHIRELTVRPNKGEKLKDETLSREARIAECWTACWLEMLAPALKNLRSFCWDGIEMPTDSLWATLRECCPDLRSIGTSIGHDALEQNSELYKFSNLLEFSLQDKSPKYTRHDFWLMQLDLPDALWDMIIFRCPSLCSLAITGSDGFYRAFDLSRLREAQWPALYHLKLGDCHMLAPGGFFPMDDAESPLAIFLHKHCPTLKSLELTQMHRVSLPSCFPKLVTYDGPLKSFAELTKFPMLESFRSPTAIMDDCALCQVSFPPLVHLKLLGFKAMSMVSPPPSPMNGKAPLESVLQAFPHIVHLEYTSIGRLASMEQYSAALQRAPNLSFFSLSVIDPQGFEESITKSAARFAQQNPQLKAFVLKLSKSPFRYKKIGYYEVEYGVKDGLKMSQTKLHDPLGSHNVASDRKNCRRAVVLRAHEMHTRRFLKPSIRRFRYDLDLSPSFLHAFDRMRGPGPSGVPKSRDSGMRLLEGERMA